MEDGPGHAIRAVQKGRGTAESRAGRKGPDAGIMNMQTTKVVALSVQQLADALKSERPPTLVDCREPREWSFCRIEGARHIPMSTIRTRFQELESDEPIVVYCHHGMRSLQVTLWLKQQGFENVASMAGGIDAWATTIDPTLPRY